MSFILSIQCVTSILDSALIEQSKADLNEIKLNRVLDLKQDEQFMEKSMEFS